MYVWELSSARIFSAAEVNFDEEVVFIEPFNFSGLCGEDTSFACSGTKALTHQ
jgi:hypothetical protein